MSKHIRRQLETNGSEGAQCAIGYRLKIGTGSCMLGTEEILGRYREMHARYRGDSDQGGGLIP